MLCVIGEASREMWRPVYQPDGSFLGIEPYGAGEDVYIHASVIIH